MNSSLQQVDAFLQAKPATTIRDQEEPKKIPEPEDEGSKHPFIKHPKAEGTLTLSAKVPSPPVLVPAEAVRTICNYEGIKVQVRLAYS